MKNRGVILLVIFLIVVLGGIVFVTFFNEDANSLSMTALELALNYVVSIHEVDRVIVGVNTVQHIEDITSCKFKEITLKDFRGLSVKDPNFLNPSLWPSW